MKRCEDLKEGDFFLLDLFEYPRKDPTWAIIDTYALHVQRSKGSYNLKTGKYVSVNPERPVRIVEFNNSFLCCCACFNKFGEES